MTWQDYLPFAGARLVTTEAVCWEWLDAMSGVATRRQTAAAFERILNDPLIEVVPHNEILTAQALRVYSSRSDKEWSLTGCLEVVIMGQRSIREALTADDHFVQAGYRAVLLGRSTAGFKLLNLRHAHPTAKAFAPWPLQSAAGMASVPHPSNPR